MTVCNSTNYIACTQKSELQASTKVGKLLKRATTLQHATTVHKIPLIPIISHHQQLLQNVATRNRQHPSKRPIPASAPVCLNFQFQMLLSNESTKEAELLDLGVEPPDIGTVGDVGTLTGLGQQVQKNWKNTDL